MLAFENSFSDKFIWREAKTRKSKGLSSMALNSYNNRKYKEREENRKLSEFIRKTVMNACI